MNKGRHRIVPPAKQKPVDASTAAPHLRTFMIKLFDREDGHAADWALIAETLLAGAFHALDQSPGDPRASVLLRRAYAGIYDRLAGTTPNGGGASHAPAAGVFNGSALQPSRDDVPKD